MMKKIYSRCAEHGERDGCVNCFDGVRIAGFKKVNAAMLVHGVVK